MCARRWLQASLLLAIFWTSPSAHAQPEPLAVQLRLQDDLVHTQFSVNNAFTEAFRRRLSGGLTSRAVVSVELLDPDSKVIAVRTRRCELRLDVWDDQVYLRIQDGQRVNRRIFTLIDDGLKAYGRIDIPVMPVERLTAPAGYRVRVRVALNPISTDLLERSRQFTSNPRGTASGSPRSFFGAVARLFRSESDAGATVFEFQSVGLVRPSTIAGPP